MMMKMRDGCQMGRLTSTWMLLRTLDPQNVSTKLTTSRGRTTFTKRFPSSCISMPGMTWGTSNWPSVPLWTTHLSTCTRRSSSSTMAPKNRTQNKKYLPSWQHQDSTKWNCTGCSLNYFNLSLILLKIKYLQKHFDIKSKTVLAFNKSFFKTSVILLTILPIKIMFCIENYHCIINKSNFSFKIHKPRNFIHP